MKHESKSSRVGQLTASSLERRAVMSMLLACASSARAIPLGSALERPAVVVLDPTKVVLLGAAMAGKRLVVVGERGVVLHSDDLGKTWGQARVPVSVTMTAVRFADKDRGYATGHGGTIMSTSDGGASWQRALNGQAIAAMMLEAARPGGDSQALRAAENLC